MHTWWQSNTLWFGKVPWKLLLLGPAGALLTVEVHLSIRDRESLYSRISHEWYWWKAVPRPMTWALSSMSIGSKGSGSLSQPSSKEMVTGWQEESTFVASVQGNEKGPDGGGPGTESCCCTHSKETFTLVCLCPVFSVFSPIN
jgi:hypothetical protein